MTLTADRVLLDMGPLEQNRGRIIIPESMRKHKSWAKVVAIGPDVKHLKQGDQILYRMDDAAQIDGYAVQVLKLNTHTHPLVLMDEALIQAKFTKRMNSIVDFSKVAPLGANILLDLEIPKQEHEGLWVPEFKFGSKPLVGKVVAMGDNAMDMFANKQEIQKGDTVMIARQVSGGMLPYQESLAGGPRYFRTLSVSITCVMRKGAWSPVRDNLMVRALWPDIEPLSREEMISTFMGVQADQIRYKKKNGPLVIIPSLPNPRMGVVVAAGGNMDPFNPNEQISAAVHCELKPKTRVLIPELFSPGGKIQIGDVIQGKDPHDMVVILKSRHVIASLGSGEYPDSFLSPKMDMSSLSVTSMLFGDL